MNPHYTHTTHHSTLASKSSRGVAVRHRDWDRAYAEGTEEGRSKYGSALIPTRWQGDKELSDAFYAGFMAIRSKP